MLKPFQFNDFLEKVSDLLMETDALASPIRQKCGMTSLPLNASAKRAAARVMNPPSAKTNATPVCSPSAPNMS